MGRKRATFSTSPSPPASLFLLLLITPLLSSGQNTTNTSSSLADNLDNSNTTLDSVPQVNFPQNLVPGCGSDLDPIYSYLCNTKDAWGIVVETLATLGFLVTIGLLVGVVIWTICLCVRSSRSKEMGGSIASFILFLIGTAGVFALTFAFVISPTPQTCPTRVFLFGVLFALCFSALLSRTLALRGFAIARGWGEAGLTLALFTVQVIIATEWLLIVLVRDQQPCYYTQGEFVMLLIYVLCLLALALLMSMLCLCCGRKEARVQTALICLTLVLSACIWVVWIALLTRGNLDMGQRPAWDDPVLSVALVSNGWVLLLGHGLARLGFLCRGVAKGSERRLDHGAKAPGPGNANKKGRQNGGYEIDSAERGGKRPDPVLRSPYESGFTMTEIDPGKNYSIPRAQTTNTDQPFEKYYGHRISP